MQENFKILLAIDDENLARQIKEKIQKQLKEIDPIIDFVNEGVRAYRDFKAVFYNLVICTADLPGMNGIDLVNEIHKIDGGVNFLLLADHEVTDIFVETILLPISEWDNFLGKIVEFIPEEIKVKYGLTKRNTHLINKLLDYAQTHLEDHDSKLSHSLSFIPSYFEENRDNSSVISNPTKNSSEPEIKMIKMNTRVPLIINLILVVLTLLAFAFKDEYEILYQIGWPLLVICLIYSLGVIHSYIQVKIENAN